MKIETILLPDLVQALQEGYRTTRATLRISVGYTLLFVVAGTLICGGLAVNGLSPFIIAAAGAFMLSGPIILAGFFGITQAYENQQIASFSAIKAGFFRADPTLWILVLICGLLFMIFVTDAAILYAYIVGRTPVWPTHLLEPDSATMRFYQATLISGGVIALMLFCVSAFSVPLLCEKRTNLVNAVVISVKTVFSNFALTLSWAILVSSIIIASVLLLPLLTITLPWLAHASWALYRKALPKET